METLMTIASFAGIYGWFQWYMATWPSRLHQMRRSVEPWLLTLVPVVCLAVIWFVLTVFAASDVVTDLTYILLYFGLGALWLRAAEWLFRFLGISAEYDVTDRGNRAAFAALLIASLGLRRGNAGGFGGIIPVPERGG